MSDVDEAWEEFLDLIIELNNESKNKENLNKLTKEEIPKASDIYISTKTIIGFLNSEINLNEIFWKINILPYHIQNEGVIKKQIKINSSSKEEVEKIKNIY